MTQKPQYRTASCVSTFKSPNDLRDSFSLASQWKVSPATVSCDAFALPQAMCGGDFLPKEDPTKLRSKATLPPILSTVEFMHVIWMKYGSYQFFVQAILAFFHFLVIIYENMRIGGPSCQLIALAEAKLCFAILWGLPSVRSRPHT